MDILEKFFIAEPNIGENISNIIENIKANFSQSNFAVFADWDRTLTCDISPTWNAVLLSGVFPKELFDKGKQLYKKYRSYELGERLYMHRNDEKSLSISQARVKYMNMWWVENMELLKQYGEGGEEKLMQIIREEKYIKFKHGVEKFLLFLNENNIPLIIVSAGLGNLIYDYLDYYKIDMSYISVETNMLSFENGNIVGFDHDHIVHSANKSQVPLSEKTKKLLEGKRDFLVLGDGKDDIEVKNISLVKQQTQNILSIGIMSHEGKPEMFHNTGFDVVNLRDDYLLINELLGYITG